MPRDYWFAFGPKPSTNTGLNPTFITFVNGSGATIAPPTIAETYVGSGQYKSTYNATQTISFVLDGATTGLADSIRYIFGVFDPQDQFGQTLINISDRSLSLIALGQSNIALGNSSIAQGMTLTALGTSNIALGTTGIAQGITLTAIGNTSLAYGITGLAQGVTILATENQNNATLITAVNAIGSTLIAEGMTLVAIGNTLLSVGTGSVAGIGSTASPFGDVSTQPDTVFGYLKRVVEFLEGNQTYTKSSGALQFASRGSSAILANKTVSDTVTETTKT